MNWYGYVLLTFIMLELGVLTLAVMVLVSYLSPLHDAAAYFKQKVNEREPGTFK